MEETPVAMLLVSVIPTGESTKTRWWFRVPRAQERSRADERRGKGPALVPHGPRHSETWTPSVTDRSGLFKSNLFSLQSQKREPRRQWLAKAMPWAL